MTRIAYQKFDDHSSVSWGLLALNAVVVLAGLGAAFFMEHNGHIVTGMSNQIVWGMPHVFAVFLIIAASGALNVASIASVFDRQQYKPYARLSALLAIALLVGGLAVLVLDLGRPERLIVAMTTYNFKSIFAWNIYLYIGFLAIVAAYLFVMMDRQASRSILLGKTVGGVAFVWRLVLTTGTGSIFGWLVARHGSGELVGGGIIGRVVGNDHRHRAGLLGNLAFVGEGGCAALDEGNVAAHGGSIVERGRPADLGINRIGNNHVRDDRNR